MISVPLERTFDVSVYKFPTQNSNNGSKKDQIQTNPTYRCLATDVYCCLQSIKLGQNVKSQPIKDKEIINLSEKVQSQPKRLSPIALYRLFQLFRKMDGLKIRG